MKDFKLFSCLFPLTDLERKYHLQRRTWLHQGQPELVLQRTPCSASPPCWNRSISLAQAVCGPQRRNWENRTGEETSQEPQRVIHRTLHALKSLSVTQEGPAQSQEESWCSLLLHTGECPSGRLPSAALRGTQLHLLPPREKPEPLLLDSSLITESALPA